MVKQIHRPKDCMERFLYWGELVLVGMMMAFWVVCPDRRHHGLNRSNGGDSNCINN